MLTWYDTIGRNYPSLRVPDVRIGGAIAQALGDAENLVNVGAGTGAYEPPSMSVVAVEPSASMLAPYSGLGPHVQGAAEALPIADQSVGARLAVLTLHHWRDWRAGLRELDRVCRDRVVLFTHEPDLADFWLL